MIDEVAPIMTRSELRVMLVLKRWAIDDGCGSLTKTQVAKRANVCYRAARAAIAKLEQLGIVRWLSHGRYQLNWYYGRQLNETVQDTMDRLEVV